MSILSMTKTLLKSVFHGPYTVLYPIEEKKVYDYTKGCVEINISECIYCGMCMRNCPTGALQVDRNESKWSINRLACIQCRYCVQTCPKHCLSMTNHHPSPRVEKAREEFTNARVSDNSDNN